GDAARPLCRRPGSSERGARPGGGVGQRLARRHVPGVPGHPGAGAEPAGGGPGAAGRGAGPEPGEPQHTQRDVVSGRVRPVGARGGGALKGGAGGGGGWGAGAPGRGGGGGADGGGGGQGEAEVVAEVRQALGADRFDRVFAAGARLTQPEALAAARTGTAPAPD